MTNQQTNSTTVVPRGDREIVSERIFDAPRERVFEAFTDPALIPHWWGPHGVTTSIDKMDARTGGDWRFICSDDQGTTSFRGTYREITPPERAVQTFEWAGMPGHVLVDSSTFEDLDGRTKVTTVSLFHTTEERDGMLASGMQGGLSESYERLDELLAS